MQKTKSYNQALVMSALYTLPINFWWNSTPFSCKENLSSPNIDRIRAFLIERNPRKKRKENPSKIIENNQKLFFESKVSTA